MYIIKRIDEDGGGYVARTDSRQSYTQNIDLVRIFKTKKEAERNRCVENEVVVPLDEI